MPQIKDSLNVHFIAPKTNLAEEIENFRLIVQAIHKRGHSLAKDWLEPGYLRFTHKKEDEAIDWSSSCRANIEAIPSSDIIIAEISTKSFGVGYQVGLAVAQKKPTLLLRREGISKEAFLGGLDSPYVQKLEYTPDTIDGIVGDFLEKDEDEVKDIRFNMLIDRKLNNYLKQSALISGKTKAEIIRELLLREIDREN
jgi:nucleoside 2-deoxyribosyltransferase